MFSVEAKKKCHLLYDKHNMRYLLQYPRTALTARFITVVEINESNEQPHRARENKNRIVMGSDGRQGGQITFFYRSKVADFPAFGKFEIDSSTDYKFKKC